MGYISKHCPMCGAEPGEPCTYVSPNPPAQKGDERPDVHFYRSNDHPIPVLIPEEPPFAAAPLALDESRHGREEDTLGTIEHRIERAINEGEEVLIGQLGDPPNEEAWADLAGMVIGDLADDYRGAVDLLREARDLIESASYRLNGTDRRRDEWLKRYATTSGGQSETTSAAPPSSQLGSGTEPNTKDQD